MKFHAICAAAVLSILPFASARADQGPTILTDNVVELRETISPQGFVHPGISCNAETLSVMREKVLNGVSPWVDHFEGMRRTRFADLKRKPAFVKQITNDGGIGGFAHDFVDVPPGAPYFDDVAYMSSKGIGNTWAQPVKYVTADDQKRFHPNAPISRGELAGIMSRMQWLKGDGGPALKDVAVGAPNAGEMRRVAREGWMTADDAGQFRPDAPVTRAEFVVAVNRMTKRTEHPREGMPSFSDLESSHWAYDDILKAAMTYSVQPGGHPSR